MVAGLCVAFFVFPTRYRCNGDDLTFTTSKAFAEDICPTGVTGDVVADQRLAPRLAVLAVVLVWAAVFLRLASDERFGRSTSPAKGPNE